MIELNLKWEIIIPLDRAIRRNRKQEIWVTEKMKERRIHSDWSLMKVIRVQADFSTDRQCYLELIHYEMCTLRECHFFLYCVRSLEWTICDGTNSLVDWMYSWLINAWMAAAYRLSYNVIDHWSAKLCHSESETQKRTPTFTASIHEYLIQMLNRLKSWSNKLIWYE
jgi:hypothetical protein